MHCAHCGSSVVAGQRFCAACGQPVAQACSACGEDLPEAARFCISCGHKVEGRDPAERALAKPSRERRQITVLFIDIVGSVAMLQELELEEYESLIGSFRTLCAGRAKALGGTILKFLGDGIMMGFGYPQVRENAAASAVECGLGIIETLERWECERLAEAPDLPDEALLRVRIGIETGLALTGTVAEESQALLGDAPNMAARIQSLAETNRVVVGPTTARIVRDYFTMTSMGPQEIRGRRDPIPLFEIGGIAARKTVGRRDPKTAVRFVGRRQELDLLRALWSTVETQHGTAVLLIGEPGIGKSRSVMEFLSSQESETSAVTLQCLPQTQASDLAPLGGYFRSLRNEAESEDIGAAIVAEAEGVAEPDEALVEAFRQTFSLSPTEGEAPAAVTAELRRRAIDVAQRWFEQRARAVPIVLIAEDLHWADEETLNFLKALIARQSGEKRLVIMTARPEFACSWLARLKVHQVPIEGFSPSETGEMIMARLEATAVSPSLIAALHAHSGGVPLFLEELVASLLETDRLTRDGDMVRLVDGSVSGVPTTIMDLIMSRLDRLGKARWLAQVAAVSGRQCPVSLIASVTGRSLEDLTADIDALLESGLLEERGVGSEAILEFKHALVQEAAYQTLPRDVREAYHLKIAEALAGDREAAVRAHEIAAHFDNAGRPDLSFDHWMAAGTGAIRRSANEEALRHLRAAVSAARQRRDLADRDRAKSELSARLAMSAPSIAVHGWSASIVETQYREAERLSQSVGDRQQSFDILRGKLNVYLLRGDLAPGRTTAEAIAREAEAEGGTTSRIEALRSLAVCDFLAGDFEPAQARLLEMRQLYSGSEHHDIAFRYGSNPFVVGESWRSWALCLTGDQEAAESVIETAIEEALANDHAFSLCYALCFKASIQQCGGAVEAAEATARRIIDLAHRQGFPYWVAWAEIVRGWALAKQGDPSFGSERTRDGLRGLAAVGARQILTYGLTLLAETLEERPVARRAVMKRAAVSMGRTGIRFYQPALEALARRLDESLPDSSSRH
ncbi:MAG: adenylate/guanylate cyclase domain-containing protein [Kiloniellales bacterium]